MYKGKGQVEKSCNVFGSLAPPHPSINSKSISSIKKKVTTKQHTGNSIFPMLHHVTGKRKIVSEDTKKKNQNSSVLHFLLRCVWNENLRIIINKNSQNWCLQRTHAFCFIVLKNPQRRRCTFFFVFKFI